jgi:ABC-2 type transport system permease protein
MSTTNVLLPVRETGWRSGFANLLSKEAGAWWRTRGWLIQTIIWVAILDGILAMLLFAAPSAEAAGAEGIDHAESTIVFLTIGLISLAIGATIIGQEAVIDEKRSGTAAWVLSKPASRTAFILAKLVAHGLGLLVTGVIIPGVIAFGMITAAGGSIAITNFSAALGLVWLSTLFYLTLTLMLGTLFEGRGAVIAIPIAFVFGYQIFLSLAPWLADITPWGFLFGAGSSVPQVARVALGQAGLPTMPVIATIGWCVLFTIIALWRFGREEF